MRHALAATVAHEPQPTITITCRKVPVPGQPGACALEPQLTFTHMPGGWDSVYKMLAQCQMSVVYQMLDEAKGQQRVQVVPALPGDLVRH